MSIRTITTHGEYVYIYGGKLTKFTNKHFFNNFEKLVISFFAT